MIRRMLSDHNGALTVFECIVAGQDSGSKGVAVLFKNQIEYKIHSVVKDDEGRCI